MDAVALLAFCVDLARGGSQELFGFSYERNTQNKQSFATIG